MSDIRLKIGWDRHPKIRRLRKTLRAEGVLALVQLWTFTAAHYARGILTSLDFKDIADAAEWSGDPQRFVDTLQDLKLLDFDGEYSIHDWKEHQPWAYFSSERSESAKMAARVKWANRDKSGMRSALLPAVGTALPTAPAERIQSVTAPSPSPSPSPVVKDSVTRPGNGRFTPPTVEQVAEYCEKRKNRVDPVRFHAYYTSNGWKVGKNPMRNWKAAVVSTWEKERT